MTETLLPPFAKGGQGGICLSAVDRRDSRNSMKKLILFIGRTQID